MNEFQKSQAEKILSMYNNADEVLEKSKGEGSRGGKVIGHTKSGKPIYDSKTFKQSVDKYLNLASEFRNLGLSVDTNTTKGSFTVEISKDKLDSEKIKKINSILDSKKMKPKIVSFNDAISLSFEAQKVEKSIDLDIEKGKKAMVGEKRTHGGVEKEKQADGSWKEVKKDDKKSTLSGQEIGKTKSGKTIYYNHDHESHKDFTEGDHLDAYYEHIKLGHKYAKEYQNDNKHESLTKYKHHNKQAIEHENKYLNF